MAALIGDTIVALASGAGRAGVAVVRVSGPAAFAWTEAVARRLAPPRRATLARLFDPRDGGAIDQAIVIVFPSPASFTGEDVAEFHLHGGRAVVTALLEAALAHPGIRLAEPGEFSRRAVENGRMDLTAAEGIADLVAADTAAQRRQALNLAGGALERAALDWRDRLIRSMAHLEAEIDFPDEADVPALLARVVDAVGEVRAEMGEALVASSRGERLREGARIVIAGPPNAGKSTLVNALARRDVAIVSDVAGTTRDVIEVHLDLGGYPATLLDTAGLRETADTVERIGVERARAAAAEADLVLWVTSDGAEEGPPALNAPMIRVETKSDLTPEGRRGPGRLWVSGATGEGLDHLARRLEDATRRVLEGSEAALVTRLRHRREIEAAVAAIDRGIAVSGPDSIELMAEDIRLALRAIGRLTGAVDIDEIYDVIFHEFCIGK